MLCNVCHSIFTRTFEPDSSSGVHRWAARFRLPRLLSKIRLSAAQDKCYICIAVLKQWDKQTLDPDEKGDDLQLTYSLEVPDKVSDSQLRVSLYLKERSAGSVTFWLIASQTEDTSRPSLIASDNTGSQETLRFLKDRVKECDEQHPQCHTAQRGTNWYPTRLIDVGTASDPANRGVVKLIITVETPPQGSYASLSHCWGNAQMKRLEQKSLEPMKEEILLSQLPKTFRDTVVVCHALNIRYVWIDSLCIVQDSNSDWQREARRMLEVYTNASLNIAATSASNGQVGLF